ISERIQSEGLASKFTPVRGNFKNLKNLAEQHGFNQVNGVLYDLGYSSSQLADSNTGLSFLHDQPLDMRLDANLGVTAADLVNVLSEKDLTKMFFDYSDELLSRKFAKAIVEYRNLKKFQTTKDLADLIASVAPPGYEHGRIHPATRIFQALRIVVNAELENLEVSLPQAAQILLPGGRMIVISFHSLEDKLVKNFGHTARPLEISENGIREVLDKPRVPAIAEVEQNTRARSAKMRVFEKI
ncbi:MAG TPA: 16S rRNA (cytosine(1402)-N(4))-methyltransferase RsmH, partial [Candidatus Saccharimonadales bacterium]|nr:16S rRNA (cytosine(1402)-N(4))-methyltransferase RsmH [Candidatus Saccharimonadales bacterium]